MADEKPQPAKDATKEVAEKPTVGDAGARTAATESQVGVAGAAQTRDESLKTFTDNLTKLNVGLVDGKPTMDIPSVFPTLRPDGTVGAPPGGDRAGVKLADAPAKIEPTAPPTDSKGLIRTDGKIDMPTKKPDGMSDKDFEAMRTQVEALNKHLTDPKAQLTDQQRQDLERSAEQMISNKNPDGSERKPPLDPREATKVLEQANRMFDKQDVITGNGFSVQDRNLAVAAMVHDVANPNHANQGLNNTCNVSAVAKAEMMTHPGDQAKRYVDMFANENNKDSKGMFVEMPDGKKPPGTQKVYYDKASITPDGESKWAADHVGGGARDAYMQGLNHLYVNSVTQPRGEYYTDGRAEFKGDTGERLHKGSFTGEVRRDKDGKIEDSPGMVAEDVQAVLNKVNAGTMAADYQRFGVTNGSGVRNVTGGDPASLDAAWNANGGKPMVIAVDTNAAMFRSASDVGGKTEGGGHVVTLADRRVGPDGKVEYLLQNSWGDKFNGWVSADAIASAMNPRNGDRSGAVPTAGGDSTPGSGGTPADGGSNWGNQSYRRPSGGNDQTSGDGSNYHQPDAPERDPRGGIKTDQDRTNEMDYRSQLERERAAALLQKAMQEQEDANKTRTAKEKAEQEEALRKAEEAKRLKEEEEARRRRLHEQGHGRDNPSE